MACKVEVLFTPAECRTLRDRDLSKSICVVFDVLRATSVIVTALQNGARAVIPVEEISEALVLRKQQPDFLLAGERNGVRISAKLADGIEFDLGNSPREYSPDVVVGKTIVSTTTNGTRALRACTRAGEVLAGSFLNLAATAGYVTRNSPAQILLVCAGTGENTALEDVLAAGALCELLEAFSSDYQKTDSAEIALKAFLCVKTNVLATLQQSENAQRLRNIPELREDVEFCLRRDCFPLVGALEKSGAIVRVA